MPPSTNGAPLRFDLPRAKRIASVKRHDELALATPNLKLREEERKSYTKFLVLIELFEIRTVEKASLTRGSSLVDQQNSLWLKEGEHIMPAHRVKNSIRN